MMEGSEISFVGRQWKLSLICGRASVKRALLPSSSFDRAGFDVLAKAIGTTWREKTERSDLGPR